MLDGIQGESITVYPVSFDEKDSYGNAVKRELEPMVIDDVLIAPDDAVSLMGDGRPNATAIGYSLYIPKGIEIKWLGANVDIYGERYQVIGDPKPYPSHLVPTSRNLHVKAIRYVG